MNRQRLEALEQKLMDLHRQKNELGGHSDDEPAPSVENRGRAGRKENVAKPVPRDLSVASSVASLRSTTKEINRRRNRGNRKGKQATPRVSEDLTKSLTAAEALGSLEPIPLTRSAASELALLLEGI